MRPPTTLSIGIIALNEDQNIIPMLKSVLSQEQKSFQIKEIVIISDGSTDDTVQKIQSVHSPLIKLSKFPVRKGKSFHLNTLFKKASSDILVLFDADVLLKDKTVIENLIQPLLYEKEMVYVGGNPQPTHGKTLIEKAVNVSFKPYDQIRTHLHGGNNPYGCDGRILALKKEFYKKVTVPEDMIANDNYLYFACITMGYQFKHVRDAIVYFKSPDTIRDQIRQNKRFIAAHQRMERIFGDIVPASYYIPPMRKYTYLGLQFLRHPFLSVLIAGINSYCRLKALREEQHMNAKWAIAESTKKI